MKFRLQVWRQRNADAEGRFVAYDVDGISADMSFLEVLDTLNERLITEGDEPIDYDYDCREGICGSCSLMVDGQAHGPESGTTTCQLYMRSFADGSEIVVEPWRAGAFPVLKDLTTDRSAFDRIMQAGGYITVKSGSAPDANAILVPKRAAEVAFDAATCIGCGACVAACPNASAMLFTAAKVAHFAHLPQGQPERKRRAIRMVEAMDAEGFGNCANHTVCEAACPKGISVRYIAQLNRDYTRAALTTDDFGRKEPMPDREE